MSPFEQAGGLFSRLDRDGSGVISREEFEQAAGQQLCWDGMMGWVWINTYENTIFRGMNIHKSQLFWCSLGARVLTHPRIGNWGSHLWKFGDLEKIRPMVPLLNGSPHVDELGLSKNRIDIETGYCNLLQLAVLLMHQDSVAEVQGSFAHFSAATRCSSVDNRKAQAWTDIGKTHAL